MFRPSTPVRPPVPALVTGVTYRGEVTPGGKLTLQAQVTAEERDTGRTREKVAGQVRAGLSKVQPGDAGTVVIAYEPIWAIGTGRPSTAADAGEASEPTVRRLLEAPNADEMYAALTAEDEKY